MAAFNIAVLSDLHAYVGEENSHNSLLEFSASRENKNPLLSLVRYVRENRISADALVCAGDICNQADIDGFSRAWNVLHDLNSALQSSHLIATCGNHDLNSRYAKDKGSDDPDPKGALLSLEQRFPFENVVTNNQFWAQNFAIIELGDRFCAVVLNTSAYHGGDEGEIEHGRVSRRTIDAILVQLKNFENRRAYLLICHHHLLPMTGWGAKVDYEYVHNGTELLDALEKATRKSWLVIHGHRHQPRLLYGPTSSCGPIIFGSSSLGARMPGVPNQFHVISTEESAQSDHSSIVGTVKTWSWTETTDWIQSGKRSSGMPALCGFGFKGQIPALAAALSQLVGSNYMTWKEATQALPSLNYLTPEHMSQLELELSKGGYSIYFNAADLPVQIAPEVVA